MILGDIGKVVEDQQIEPVEAIDRLFKRGFAASDLKLLDEARDFLPPGGPNRIRLAPFSSQLSSAQIAMTRAFDIRLEPVSRRRAGVNNCRSPERQRKQDLNRRVLGEP